MNHGKWRVTVAVPRDLQGKLGTRLKRSLNTDSLSIANQLKWQVVGELKAEMIQARQGPGGTSSHSDSLTREALSFVAMRSRAETQDDEEALDHVVDIRSDELRGDPVATERDHQGQPYPFYDPEREAAAGRFRSLAMGLATPIDLHHAKFIANSGTKARTQADDHRAMKFLKAWCEKSSVSPTLEAFNRKYAARFTLVLSEIAGGQSSTTLKKYLNRLSCYWQWLETQELVTANVWHRIHRLLPPVARSLEERSFTDAEVSRLLVGQTTVKMHDLMRIGALTGARLDVIVDLKVRDCVGGVFVFKPQKKEVSSRSVPIHPALMEIIERRCEGKAPEDDVFPEWPASRGNANRERSFKASNAFTIYRRKIGVDEVIPGKRRSLVNFHSFRRWFITKAEQAGQPDSIIAFAVGHKRHGMTLSRYSAGPLLKQVRHCVEAVELPV